MSRKFAILVVISLAIISLYLLVWYGGAFSEEGTPQTIVVEEDTEIDISQSDDDLLVQPDSENTPDEWIEVGGSYFGVSFSVPKSLERSENENFDHTEDFISATYMTLHSNTEISDSSAPHISYPGCNYSVGLEKTRRLNSFESWVNARTLPAGAVVSDRNFRLGNAVEIESEDLLTGGEGVTVFIDAGGLNFYMFSMTNVSGPASECRETFERIIESAEAL